MTLAEFLSKRGKLRKLGDWLPLATFEVMSGSVWAGDPLVANAEDGVVVKVPCGTYIVEGMAVVAGRNRSVSKVRVRLQQAKAPKLGKEVGTTGTDSAMIGVCDLKAWDKAYRKVANADEEVQSMLERATRKGFGVVSSKRFPELTMPFVPTGSDGTGPVFALIAKGKRVGIEIPFGEEDEEGEDSAETAVSLLGSDREDFITRVGAGGEEVSFWQGGELKAGMPFTLWSSATRGPVEYRIRSGSGVFKDWTKMKTNRSGGAKFFGRETLEAGKYEVDFQIKDAVFSTLKLVLE